MRYKNTGPYIIPFPSSTISEKQEMIGLVNLALFLIAADATPFVSHFSIDFHPAEKLGFQTKWLIY